MTNKKPITVLEILQKIRMHVSVPQCDVFGYLSIESEIVILIIPVDHYPKALQVRLCPLCSHLVSLESGGLTVGEGDYGARRWEHRGSWRGQAASDDSLCRAETGHTKSPHCADKATKAWGRALAGQAAPGLPHSWRPRLIRK